MSPKAQGLCTTYVLFTRTRTSSKWIAAHPLSRNMFEFYAKLNCARQYCLAPSWLTIEDLSNGKLQNLALKLFSWTGKKDDPRLSCYRCWNVNGGIWGLELWSLSHDFADFANFDKVGVFLILLNFRIRNRRYFIFSAIYYSNTFYSFLDGPFLKALGIYSTKNLQN